jgi:carboxyl-terminal processing protease
MGQRLGRRLLVAIVILMGWCAPALAEKRVALVIGNGAYANASRLPNPGNDARDVAATLTRLGFDTILGLDLDRAAMDDHAVRFARAAREADVALFYYSGHAMQFAGTNYLMPVDAKLTDEADLRRLAKVDDIVADLQQARNLRILVLDSCRDNPLAEELRRSIGRTRAAGLARGLAKIDSPQGMITAYATQAGHTAEDGTGRNSPYTTAFLRHIEESEEIGTVFRRVSADVYQSTQRTQLPELSLSLIGEFYLKGRSQGLAAATPSAPATPATPPAPDNAAQAWAAIKDTTSVAVLDSFIQQYGDSVYGPFARARRDELRTNQLALAKPAPSPAASEPAKPGPPRLSRSDVTKLFANFGTILENVQKSYVEPPSQEKLLRSAIEGMRTAFPAAVRVSSAGAPTSARNLENPNVSSVHDAAFGILNSLDSGREDGKVARAAIDGLFAALDPHSGYMDGQAFRDMQVQTRGTFGGLGIEVTMENGLVKVVTPIDDTPAAKAGVLAGDLITHIDDAPVLGLTLNDAVAKMRGPVGSWIKLTVKRAGQDQPRDIRIVRDTIRVRAVRARVEDSDVGYIRISAFNEQTAKSLQGAIREIGGKVPANKLKGYIIDLRNNPGGLLSEAVAVADAFLERGEIVSTRGREAKDTQRFSAKAGDTLKGKRIVVLINGGSAAASEILAGALQDHKRATILGTRSFGKGSVQTIVPLGGDAGAIRLTTARNYTPSGRSIQAVGIVPDIEVLQDVPAEQKDKAATGGESSLPGHLSGPGGESGSQSYVPPEPKDDKALRRAVEVLRASRR